ncbi:MAG: YebC/PmpR family DNA-binding transcriptional regulator [Actinobacteria bacterium]|nr:YebC/PmpR family DNA-binding transcriptional regulator [Actinomycetota bacterium]MBL7123729.1 YebC/PmpR family DNA-binding transcriptional regulator [Actinomycetota bacterium]
MSGHSKWHSIKHKKAKEDAKRGNIFGKLSRNIIVAVKDGGGGDPRDNMALANAIAKAKEYNMPQNNIERAIKRGTGEIEGENYESILYEGYGPGGIAIIIEVMTENRNRTASDIRNILGRYNGTLGESGSVSWQFEMKGVIIVEKSEIKDEEEFMLNVIDIGAEDIDEDYDVYEIKVPPTEFINVKEALEKNNIKIKSSEIGLIPKSAIKLSKEESVKALKLINALDEHDDVQNVNSNLEISDEILSEI